MLPEPVRRYDFYELDNVLPHVLEAQRFGAAWEREYGKHRKSPAPFEVAEACGFDTAASATPDCFVRLLHSAFNCDRLRVRGLEC